MQNNKSISECFDSIDISKNTTLPMPELETALIRFHLHLTDKELKTFMKRLDKKNKGYITKNEFIQRFWSAYTYDDVFEDEEQKKKEDK